MVVGKVLRKFCAQSESGEGSWGFFVYDMSGGKLFEIFAEWYESGAGCSGFLWKNGSRAFFEIFGWTKGLGLSLLNFSSTN